MKDFIYNQEEVNGLINEFIEDLKEFNVICKGFSVVRVQTIYDLSTKKQKEWKKRIVV